MPVVVRVELVEPRTGGHVHPPAIHQLDQSEESSCQVTACLGYLGADPFLFFTNASWARKRCR